MVNFLPGIIILKKRQKLELIHFLTSSKSRHNLTILYSWKLCAQNLKRTPSRSHGTAESSTTSTSFSTPPTRQLFTADNPPGNATTTEQTGATTRVFHVPSSSLSLLLAVEQERKNEKEIVALALYGRPDPISRGGREQRPSREILAVYLFLPCFLSRRGIARRFLWHGFASLFRTLFFFSPL